MVANMYTIHPKEWGDSFGCEENRTQESSQQELKFNFGSNLVWPTFVTNQLNWNHIFEPA